MFVASWCCKSFCVVPCASFCTGHFVMVPLNMTYLHLLQHSLFEHLFNLYCNVITCFLQKTLFEHLFNLYCYTFRSLVFLSFLMCEAFTVVDGGQLVGKDQFGCDTLIRLLLFCTRLSTLSLNTPITSAYITTMFSPKTSTSLRCLETCRMWRSGLFPVHI